MGEVDRIKRGLVYALQTRNAEQHDLASLGLDALASLEARLRVADPVVEAARRLADDEGAEFLIVRASAATRQAWADLHEALATLTNTAGESGEGEAGPTYDEIVTGPGPEMTPEIRARLEEIAKHPRRELSAKPLPVEPPDPNESPFTEPELEEIDRRGKKAEPPGVVLSELRQWLLDHALTHGGFADAVNEIAEIIGAGAWLKDQRRALLDRKGADA